MRNAREHLSMHAENFPHDGYLRLVEITDDAGKRVKGEAGLWNNSEQIFSFDSGQDVKKLNFVFALTKYRFVEFMAKPDYVGGN